MIKEYTILKVYVSEKSKDGKAFESFGRPAKKVALKLEGIDGYVSTYPSAKLDDPIFRLKEGDRKKLILWEKDGFKNFKIPNKIDELEERVARLEKDVYEEASPVKSGYNETQNSLDDEIKPEDIPF